MLEKIMHKESKTTEPIHIALAFAIGALVGVGIAATWVPQRRRSRLPEFVDRPYQKVRQAGGAAVDEIRRASRDLAGDFREELGASIEAARDEFKDMAAQQMDQVRRTLRKERKKLLR